MDKHKHTGSHTGTDTNTDNDSQDNPQAGTDSGSYNRQTMDGRHREHKVANSNLDSMK